MQIAQQLEALRQLAQSVGLEMHVGEDELYLCKDGVKEYPLSKSGIRSARNDIETKQIEVDIVDHPE